MRVLLILFIAAILLEASANDGRSSEKRGRIKPQLRQLPNQDIGDEVTTAAAPSFPIHRSYLPVKVCEKLFYCLPQLQGPCPVNKMMVPHDGSIDDHPIPCSSLAVYPFRGCVSSSHLSEELLSSIPTVAPAAKCVIRFPGNPCHGLPRHYRFYEPANICYPLGSYQRGNQSISSPCGTNETFADVDGRRGDCRCRDRHFLMLNGTCYRALTRGPCQSDEWLEPSENGLGYCHPSPCSEGQRDGLHIFWNGPYSRPGCYRANTPGPCGEGAVFVIDDYLHQRGRCFWPYRPHSGHFRPAGRRPNHRRPRPQFGRRQENPLAAAGDRSRPASSSGPYANELGDVDEFGPGEDF